MGVRFATVLGSCLHGAPDEGEARAEAWRQVKQSPAYPTVERVGQPERGHGGDHDEVRDIEQRERAQHSSLRPAIYTLSPARGPAGEHGLCCQAPCHLRLQIDRPRHEDGNCRRLEVGRAWGG